MLMTVFWLGVVVGAVVVFGALLALGAFQVRITIDKDGVKTDATREP
jgi:hypothetical protein